MPIKRRTAPDLFQEDMLVASGSFPLNIVAKEKKPLPETAILDRVYENPSVTRSMGSAALGLAAEFNVADLVKIIRTPLNSDDPIELKYRARIRNRGTAITAKCVDCQGGSRKKVTECGNTSCPLWAFRFGSAPRMKK